MHRIGPIFTALLLIAASVAVSAPVQPSIVHESGQVIVTTDRYRLAFSPDGFVHAANLLTGELYTFADPSVRPVGLAGLDSLTGTAWTPDGASFTVETVGELSVRIVQEKDSATLQTTISLDRETGDLLVQQEVTGAEPGLIGPTLALDRIDLGACSVIIPALGGVQADPLTTATCHTLAYPGDWEAQLAVLQGKRGGLAIWAEDVSFRFKRLTYKRMGNEVALGFLTEEDAPFDRNTSASSVTWRINAYRGDWRTPASAYRKWMAGAFGLVPLEKAGGWADGIRAVVTIHGRAFNESLLRDLADRLDPSATLLYIADWRADPYDVNYPDYTPMEGFADFVQAAHDLGFRVMLHVDICGVSPSNELFDEFSKYQWRSGRTGRPGGWFWDADESIPYRFAYITPAAKAFRDLFVERMVGVYKTLRPDALHLDVSHAIVNDANGLVDGMRFPQGAVKLHRELESRLPGVVLGGEGMHELLVASRERFGQLFRHESGLRPHPITSFLFSPYARYYGHLSLQNPDRDETGYVEYMRQYVRRGVLPTLPLDASVKGLGPDMPGSLRIVREARVWQDEKLRPDFSSSWGRNDVFRYRAADGTRVSVELTSAGMRMYGRKVGMVWEMIDGGWSIRTDGSVPGWPAYDGRTAFGFPPDAGYFLSAAPPRMDRLHISDLSRGLVIRRSQRSEQAYLFQMDAVGGAIDLVRLAPSATAGTIIDDKEGPLQKGAVFEPRKVTVGGVSESGLYAVMPWHPKKAGMQDYPWGQVYMDFFVKVPHRRARLLFDYGVSDEAGDKSDGVMFIVTVDNTETVFQDFRTKGPWASASVDLSKWAGKLIRLRFIADPGPWRNVSYDLACWGRPRIVESKRLFGPLSVSVWSPEPLNRWFAYPDGSAELVRQAPSPRGEGVIYKFAVTPPLTLGMVLQPAEEVSYPVDLLRLEPLVGIVSGGIWKKARMYDAGIPREEVIDGVKKRVLPAHPPGHGRTVLQWSVHLPPGPGATLSAFVGVAEKSRTGGVIFQVTADGRPLYTQYATKPGWSAVSVDMSEFTGRDVLLSLETDSAGDNFYDWALWATPVITSP